MAFNLSVTDAATACYPLDKTHRFTLRVEFSCRLLSSDDCLGSGLGSNR